MREDQFSRHAFDQALTHALNALDRAKNSTSPEQRDSWAATAKAAALLAQAAK